MGALLTNIFGWVFRTIIIKFFLFTALFMVVSEFSTYLMTKFSAFNPSALNSSLASLSPAMWYFIDLTMFSVGFPLIVSAYITRFAIRRIPLLG